ncbi:ABC transporter permease [Candidatus Soleaferrea massiliensis]|uniref:ABC transporter permease n=1 Tax=Candidatus Soleaferrea massiliensis TaxID=1470354 RepID=UPI000590024C|nr:ABC transporter permease [Candidatus Soleaferrea massiliensis]
MFDLIRHTIKNITRKKTRTLLTVISIAIGVCSVVIISSIADIGKNTLNEEIDSFGIGSMTIRADTRQDDIKLYESDLDYIREKAYVEDAIPIMMNYTSAKMRGVSTDCAVWGIDSTANQVISIQNMFGRMINAFDVQSKSNVCLVDESYAQRIYKRTNVTGKKLSILIGGTYEEFTIIGVVASGGNVLQSLIGEYVPTFLYIPYTTLQDLLNRTNFDQIAVKVKDGVDVSDIGDRLVKSLSTMNGISSGYKYENIMGYKDQFNNILDIVSFILSVIAGISLVVAGLGIMTMMLVSVNERTREIGIKKSIGAKNRTILLEFLIEAFTISLIGSIIGTIVGLLLVVLGCLLVGVTPILNPLLIAVSIAFATLTGMFFGVFPAHKASKLNPVDALRME